MQASKTATAGSNAIALRKVLGVLGERLHRPLLGIHLRFQRQYILNLRAAMLADIPERQIAHVHPMHNEWAGDPKNVGCVVRAEFLTFGEHGDSFTLEEAAEGGLKQRRGLRWEPHDLILTRLAPDPDLDLIALAISENADEGWPRWIPANRAAFAPEDAPMFRPSALHA